MEYKKLKMLHGHFRGLFWIVLIFGCIFIYRSVKDTISVCMNIKNFSSVYVKIDEYDQISMGEGGSVIVSVANYNRKRIIIDEKLIIGNHYLIWYDSINNTTFLASSKNESKYQFKIRIIKQNTFIILLSLVVILSFLYIFILLNKKIKNKELKTLL
jgi:hypothetical protein